MSFGDENKGGVLAEIIYIQYMHAVQKQKIALNTIKKMYSCLNIGKNIFML